MLERCASRRLESPDLAVHLVRHLVLGVQTWALVAVFKGNKTKTKQNWEGGGGGLGGDNNNNQKLKQKKKISFLHDHVGSIS